MRDQYIIKAKPPILNLLDLIQKTLDLLRLLKIRLEDRRRGCTRESLSNHQDPRVLEGIEDLSTKEAAGSSDQNCGRHLGDCSGEVVYR